MDGLQLIPGLWFKSGKVYYNSISYEILVWKGIKFF